MPWQASMRALGVILVSLGIVALVYGGFSYSGDHTVMDMGPIQATATEHHRFPVSPFVGVLAIVGGLIVMITPRRRLI